MLQHTHTLTHEQKHINKLFDEISGARQHTQSVCTNLCDCGNAHYIRAFLIFVFVVFVFIILVEVLRQYALYSIANEQQQQQQCSEIRKQRKQNNNKKKLYFTTKHPTNMHTMQSQPMKTNYFFKALYRANHTI